MTIAIVAHVALAIIVAVAPARRGQWVFWLTALAPAGTLVWLATLAPMMMRGEAWHENIPWVPMLGMDLDVHIGAFQWIIATVVCLITTAVLIYCPFYFEDDPPQRRVSALLVVFCGVMLGLVTTDNLLVMYTYWELTTVFSYLLVGHNPLRRANRSAALTALTVTTFGGLAMLIGIIMIGEQLGSYAITDMLALLPQQEVTAYLAIAMVLFLLGALTKSAQVPFHFWLPGAMAAPTPISALLHAATMVKAGIFLIALLAPVAAHLPGWRPIIMVIGAATMIIGGWRALRQNDLKLVLAFGTVSQLGFMTVLAGIGTQATSMAAIGVLVSHALFKGTLFLVVGIVDHTTGTRDLRQLSGLHKKMPMLAIAAAIAAASMAGLPPTLGFITKESGLSALQFIHTYYGDGTGIPAGPALLLLATIVVGNIFTMAYSLRLWWGAFGSVREVQEQPARKVEFHAPSRAFLISPVVLAALCLVGGFLGGPLTAMVEPWVASITTGHEPHEYALWHGFSVPLLLSFLSWVVGAAMFVQRRQVYQAQETFPEVMPAREVYQKVMLAIDRLAVAVTGRTQTGSLPVYVAWILGMVVVVPGSAVLFASWPTGKIVWWTHPAQFATGIVMVLAGLFAARARGRMKAFILTGVTGYGCVVLYLFHGAPDLALTQALVETVTLAVAVLVLRKLPKYFTDRPLHSNRWWRLGLAALVGLTVFGGTSLAVLSRSQAPVSDLFAEWAYSFGYGANIVNVTLVDIRAWDTFGEISVLVVAATGVASLVFVRSRVSTVASKAAADVRADRRARLRAARARTPIPGQGAWLRGGQRQDSKQRALPLEVMIRLVFPIMLIASVYLLLAGHNLPGGGFAGGLVAGLALLLRYMAGGRYELEHAAPVDAGKVMGIGIALAALHAVLPLPFGGQVMQSYDWHLDLGILGEVHLVSTVLFDLGVYLVVVGLMLDLARSLGSGIDVQTKRNGVRKPSRQRIRTPQDRIRRPEFQDQEL
ncbi:Na+/H+ antiporter subunit A [Parenemella sanctibonifatiensis]|uniref:Na+/H+ antiporter subunit A n=1 Tax=Parenemella sanctibonifatiensis TaxID=2016505 RepID=A0A255E0R7_9ACTN|nr:Na+/H+ antiporter subunit A [Parenemella sanctibonifatiensis]OYN85134.1 Na+/H+ antiporter subunit A [Parenemella sanctibonifatiensis]